MPKGVVNLFVQVSGASGGDCPGSNPRVSGGRGGYIETSIPVTSGETLSIIVGGMGAPSRSRIIPGGYNGGGNLEIFIQNLHVFPRAVMVSL